MVTALSSVLARVVKPVDPWFVIPPSCPLLRHPRRSSAPLCSKSKCRRCNKKVKAGDKVISTLESPPIHARECARAMFDKNQPVGSFSKCSPLVSRRTPFPWTSLASRFEVRRERFRFFSEVLFVTFDKAGVPFDIGCLCLRSIPINPRRAREIYLLFMIKLLLTRARRGTPVSEQDSKIMRLYHTLIPKAVRRRELARTILLRRESANRLHFDNHSRTMRARRAPAQDLSQQLITAPISPCFRGIIRPSLVSAIRQSVSRSGTLPSD